MGSPYFNLGPTHSPGRTHNYVDLKCHPIISVVVKAVSSWRFSRRPSPIRSKTSVAVETPRRSLVYLYEVPGLGIGDAHEGIVIAGRTTTVNKRVIMVVGLGGVNLLQY